MKKPFTFVILLISFVGIGQHFVPDQVVFCLRKSAYNKIADLRAKRTGVDQIDAIAGKLGIEALSEVGQHAATRTFVFDFTADVDVHALCKTLLATGLVEYAEPNFISEGGGQRLAATVPSDFRFYRQWNFRNVGTLPGIGPVTADADTDMELAWDIQTGDPEMIIAVSDSGLKMNHPEMSGRHWVNPLELQNGLDDDGNGLIDDINGFDFANFDGNPTDDHGHGTNVAGIIGSAANNGQLYAGVNWNSKIMTIKVLSNNFATHQNMANSIYYAVSNGAKIINMSIGGPGSVTLENAIIFANIHNVILVASMGNNDDNLPQFPAAYSSTYPNVIAVGATNPNDSRTSPFFWNATSGSSFGPHINVVAPGNYIYGLDYQSNTYADGYWGGTSQASPLVAGIASLMLAQNPSLTPLEVRTILEQTAEDQVGTVLEDIPGFDQYMGHGRVNAFAALQSLKNDGATIGEKEFTCLNPVTNDHLSIILKSVPVGEYDLEISDMLGKSVSKEKVLLHEGVNIIDFHHAAGSYVVSFHGKDYSKVLKIVRE